MLSRTNRRRFLAQGLTASAAVAAAPLWNPLWSAPARAAEPAAQNESSMIFGLVTYMWGADWDLPTLLANCQKAQVLGVELRTTHAHGVEPNLNEQKRVEVANRFADSGVTLVGLGSNERFDHPDPAALKQAIEATKGFIQLSHDIGGSGVKVKPDSFHPDVPREKTIEQIGKALNELGEFAAGYGQQVRLEVHGKCAELPTIKAIMDVADNDSVAVCWNSNPTDLEGKGLEYNLGLVRKRFGETCHIHELESEAYPYEQLFRLLVKSEYAGWILLEAASKPADRVAALAQQRMLFEKLVAKVSG